MIEILPESSGNFLAVSATEQLTVDDYEKVFIPKLEELIRNYEKVRVLILFHDNFTGWEPGAMWDDARFGVRHKNDFEKIAIVGASSWIEWASKLGAHFMAGQLKSYASENFKDAINWATE